MRHLYSATLLLATALLLALALTGCSLGADSAESDAVKVSDSDDGSTQELVVDQELQISLTTNPTTGYVWEVDGAVPPQPEQVGEPEYSADSTATGSGGTEVWTFVAKEPGAARLKFKYWRSFEPTDPVIDEFAVRVEVQE